MYMYIVLLSHKKQKLYFPLYPNKCTKINVSSCIWKHWILSVLYLLMKIIYS